jgi:DNA-binding XRE family transcriptional regulator
MIVLTRCESERRRKVSLKRKQSTFEERFPARTSPAVETLAGNLRRIRLKRHLSQDGLAALIEGVDQTTISLIENSRSNPTLAMIEAIAVALETTVVDLLDPAAKR